MPAPLHALVKSTLSGALIGPFCKGHDKPREGGKLSDWWILPEPEIRFHTASGEDIVVPGQAGWRHERVPEFPDIPYFTVAPDWVCEIPCPPIRDLDLDHKRDTYAREGAPYLWIVDLDSRTLQAFKLRDGRWELLATLSDDAPVSLPPFEKITFSLGSLWA